MSRQKQVFKPLQGAQTGARYKILCGQLSHDKTFLATNLTHAKRCAISLDISVYQFCAPTKTKLQTNSINYCSQTHVPLQHRL